MIKARTFTTHVSTTNLAADTYYYTITGDRITGVAVEIVTSGGVTVTFEGTVVASPASGDWVDITEAMFSMNTGIGSGNGHGTGAGAASFIDKTDIITINKLMLRGFRIKSVTSDNTNAVKIVSCAQGDNIQISA